jgi:hypothetical protein
MFLYLKNIISEGLNKEHDEKDKKVSQNIMIT